MWPSTESSLTRQNKAPKVTVQTSAAHTEVQQAGRRAGASVFMFEFLTHSDQSDPARSAVLHL